jgi:hypothetical protein
VRELRPHVCEHAADIGGAEWLRAQVVAWCEARAGLFDGAPSRDHHRELLSRWWRDGVIWIKSAAFTEALRWAQQDLPEFKRLGDRQVLKAWRERGWITSGRDHLLLSRKIAGVYHQVVALNRPPTEEPVEPEQEELPSWVTE